MRNRTALRLYGPLLALAWCTAPASAQFRPRPLAEPTLVENYKIEATAGLWNPTPEMSVTSESLGIIGTKVDFVDDLGLTTKRLGAFGLTLHPGRKHKLRFEYLPIRYSQEATLPRDIVFNGQRYRAGVPVSSEFDWKAYRFSYEFDFISMTRGFGGFLIDTRANDITATLQTPLLNEFTRLKGLVPTVGGIARVYIVPAISITGELTGIKIPVRRDLYDFNGHFADLSLYGTVNVTRTLGAQVGYRSLDLEAVISDDSGAFTMKGLYFGVVARY
jgi:hypothetical protein